MKVLVCTQWDDVSQTCGAQTWLDSPTAIPPLSVEDAQMIAVEILVLWGVAFGLRLLARFIWRG